MPDPKILQLYENTTAGSAKMLVSIDDIFTDGEEKDDLIYRQLAITKIVLAKLGASSHKTLEEDFELYKKETKAKWEELGLK